jgi:hypothetical protein
VYEWENGKKGKMMGKEGHGEKRKFYFTKLLRTILINKVLFSTMAVGCTNSTSLKSALRELIENDLLEIIIPSEKKI